MEMDDVRTRNKSPQCALVTEVEVDVMVCVFIALEALDVHLILFKYHNLDCNYYEQCILESMLDILGKITF